MDRESCIAIIPARGGSRRIPRKNIKPFLGRPIIAYPIATLLGSGLFDHVVVSTDDDEIAEIATSLGAEVPFRRPAALASDVATTDEVVLHALAECERSFGTVDAGCCVYPTAPFVTEQMLTRGLELLRRCGATTAFPVVAFDFPIQQAMRVRGVRPEFVNPGLSVARSQDLEAHYHDAGLFYWFDAARFRREGALFAADSVVFPISRNQCQDINTFEDWGSAEFKYGAWLDQRQS